MAMSFNTALSGLSASSTDLSVIGNNIANANTTGFKYSRTEFADLYSASLRTYSGARVGTGVKVASVVQQFNQGTANTTDQSLDLAISGDGFFRVNDEGNLNPLYTRNGAFHLDNNNNIVNINNQFLSAYQADPKTGQILGTISKITVDQSDIAPAPTTDMSATLNLNSAEITPKSTSSIDVNGLILNNTDNIPTGAFNPDDPATYNSKAFTTVYDSTGASHTANLFFIRTASNEWNMRVTVDGINNFKGPVEVTNDDINASGISATKITFDTNTGKVTGISPAALKFNKFLPTGGTPGLSVASPQNLPFEFSISGVDKAIQNGGLTIGSLVGANATSGITSLSDTAAIDSTKAVPQGTFDRTDDTTYDVKRSFAIKDSNGTLFGVTQYFVSTAPGSRTWDVYTTVGTADADPPTTITDEVSISYDPNNPAPIKVTANADGTFTSRPENFEFTFNPESPTTYRADPISFSFNGLQSMPDKIPKLTADGNSAKIWVAPKEGEIPDPATYNYTTSTTIYDSQGGSHSAAFYFVKVGQNIWDMHTFVDNNELKLSESGVLNGAGSPVRLTFDSNGNLDSKEPSPPPPTYDQDGNIIINRTPTSRIDGKIPLTATMNNGASEIKFEFDINNVTQYGSPSGIAALSQDGYPTGHISSINVDNDGKISSLFTNGKTRTLGQVVMVNFANIQGLRSVGNTEWAETDASGEPLLVHPGEAGTGKIQSGSLEASNVDLTKQLVDMIVAQRTFQANAQTISAVDNLTQTIVNLR